jgi:hypothetical protein
MRRRVHSGPMPLATIRVAGACIQSRSSCIVPRKIDTGN